MSHILLDALACKPTERTPIWLMRQAGRYLPEYQKLRKEAGDIITLFKTPELACEAAMQPLRRYPLDAAILFSDILTIPDAMGLGLLFVENEGPKFEHPLRSEKSIHNLPKLDPAEDLSYVLANVRLTLNALDGKLPLIGFAGSPWTLATYMVEGGGSKDFSHIMALRAERPDLLYALLETLAEAVGAYLAAQLDAGVEAIQIFDTWGGVLADEDYQEFSLRWISHAIALAHDKHTAPCIVFCKDGGRHTDLIAECGCQAISLDTHANLTDTAARWGGRLAIQGNLDPAVLCASAEIAQEATLEVLNNWGKHPGYIFNLGHGITPQANPDTVAAVVKACHGYKH